MDTQSLKPILRLLRAETTLAVATVGDEGHAALAPIFYLLQPGPRLYWFSDPTSQHSRNLDRNPSVAAAVYRQTAVWKKIRGVQMRGTANRIDDPPLRSRIERAYIRRFQLGESLGAAIALSSLYCFHPNWMRYIDNTRGFGFKFELSL